MRNFKTFEEVGPANHIGHFHHIILVKQVMDSRRKEIDLLLMAGVTQSPCKKVHEKGGVVVAICETIHHKHR